VGRLKHIGRLVQSGRKIRGLTADEVARHCNVTRGRVYQWEKEKFILPKNLSGLSEVLKVPLPLLVAENGKKQPARATSSQKKACTV
jgi:transcriptional regulator with XRE-family HTH domain